MLISAHDLIYIIDDLLISMNPVVPIPSKFACLGAGSRHGTCKAMRRDAPVREEPVREENHGRTESKPTGLISLTSVASFGGFRRLTQRFLNFNCFTNHQDSENTLGDETSEIQMNHCHPWEGSYYCDPNKIVFSETLRVFGQLDAVKSTSKEYGQKVKKSDYSLIRVTTKIFFKTAQVLINRNFKHKA